MPAADAKGRIQYLAGLPERISLGVGVIDVKSTVIEQPEQIADLLVKAGEVVPPERLCVSTDCGMLNLKREHAQRKLQALVEGTELARLRLS